MRKIKIVHIWKDFDTFYGVHDQLLSLAKNINREEFDLRICIFNYRKNSIISMFKKLKVPIYNLQLRSKKNPFIIFKLINFLKDEKPDIIQTYCLNTNIYGGIAGKLAKVPIIIPTELTLKDQVSSKLKIIRDHLLYPLNNYIYFLSDSIVFVSKAVKEEWVGPKKLNKYKIICSPFNYDKYQCYDHNESMLHKGDNEFVIGTVARLSKEKGHKDLLDSITKIIQFYPKIKFIIAGTGPEENELKEYAFKLGVSEYIVFTGHKNNVFEELKKMDLFVLPSRSEGLGIAIIEAMAMGLPVVATNVGGIPEVVEDEITGSLVPSKNPALLADAIIDLLLNPEKSKQMGERGRERAFERFHPKKFAERHEKLYKELYTKKINKIRFRYKNRLRINNC